MQSSQPSEARSSESSQSFRAVVPPQYPIPEEVTQLGLQFRSAMRDRDLHPSAMDRAGLCLLMLWRLRANEDHPWIVHVEREVSSYATKFSPSEEDWSAEEKKLFLKELFEPTWCEDAVSPSVRSGSSRPAPVLGYGQSAPTAALIHVMTLAGIMQLQDRPPKRGMEHPGGYYFINDIDGEDFDLVGARTDSMSVPKPVELDHVLSQAYAERVKVLERYGILRSRIIKVIAAKALACSCPPSSSNGPPQQPTQKS